MSNSGIIYSIVCKVNGKRYIGQTIQDLGKQWREHIQKSKTHSHKPLYQAINKYGVSMFTIRAIEEDISISNLSKREYYWIEQFDTYKNGYNLTIGDNDEIETPSHITTIRKTIRGKGEQFSTKGNGIHLRNKVRAIHHQTGEIIEFNSMSDAAIKLNLPIGNISRAIKNEYRVGEYLWEKIDNKSKSYAIYGKRILDGKIIHHFKSIREAARVLGTGCDSGVRKALKNPSRYSWKGCRWYREQT